MTRLHRSLDHNEILPHALLPNLGPPDAGVFRLSHGDGLSAPPG